MSLEGWSALVHLFSEVKVISLNCELKSRSLFVQPLTPGLFSSHNIASELHLKSTAGFFCKCDKY